MSLFAASDVVAFQSNYLALATASYLPNVDFDAAWLLGQLQAAEADIARQLRVYLEPTKVFPFDPQTGDLAGLGAMPWDQEPGYDYDPSFFRADSWGFIVARHRPIISVDFVRMAYPNPQTAFYTIPNDWLRIDRKYGQIRMIPASASFVAPLNAFMLQAFGGGSTIPNMIQMQYTSGLQNVKGSTPDPRWADLLDAIYKTAIIRVLENAYLPQSSSISADGLAQTVAFDIQKYRDYCTERLFGPKGSNGGLWTSIHGVQGTVFGALA